VLAAIVFFHHQLHEPLIGCCSLLFSPCAVKMFVLVIDLLSYLNGFGFLVGQLPLVLLRQCLVQLRHLLRQPLVLLFLALPTGGVMLVGTKLSVELVMNRLEKMLVHHVEATSVTVVDYLYLILSELVVEFLCLGVEYHCFDFGFRFLPLNQLGLKRHKLLLVAARKPLR
jgi:hypothetical protein